MIKNNKRTLQLLHFISLIPACFPIIIFYPYEGPVPVLQILIFIIGAVALISRCNESSYARALILTFSISFLLVLMTKLHFHLWEGLADGWAEKLIWQVKQVKVLFTLKAWPHMAAFLLEWFIAPIVLVFMIFTEMRSYRNQVD